MEIVLRSSAQLIDSAYKETSKLWYDKQPVLLCPDVTLHDGNKIVHAFNDSLNVPYGPLNLHKLPA